MFGNQQNKVYFSESLQALFDNPLIGGLCFALFVFSSVYVVLNCERFVGWIRSEKIVKDIKKVKINKK